MKFRKKPQEVKAIRYTGDNYEEVKDYLVGKLHPLNNGPIYLDYYSSSLTINNIDNISHAVKGDWIIQEDDENIFAMSDKMFRKTFEEIKE